MRSSVSTGLTTERIKIWKEWWNTGTYSYEEFADTFGYLITSHIKSKLEKTWTISRREDPSWNSMSGALQSNQMLIGFLIRNNPLWNLEGITVDEDMIGYKNEAWQEPLKGFCITDLTCSTCPSFSFRHIWSTPWVYSSNYFFFGMLIQVVLLSVNDPPDSHIFQDWIMFKILPSRNSTEPANSD